MAPARGYTNILPRSSDFNVPSRGTMNSLRGTMRAPNQITELRAASAVLGSFSEELVSPTALSFSIQSGMTGGYFLKQ
jgi:hypothetical protein